MTALPGITIADSSTSSDLNHGHYDTPVASQPGPKINGEATTITLFSPAQLAQSNFLSSLQTVANDAFRGGHASAKVLPANVDRIVSKQYLLDEVGRAPGTFTYIIHHTDNDTEVIATATMWRFANKPVLEVVGATPSQLETARRNATFHRHDPLPPGIEGWELKLMCVNPNAQKQGLASILLDLCEGEMLRRVTGRDQDRSVNEIRFVLTTIHEINGKFYAKRGFIIDSQVYHPVGTMDSATGFTVSHMSKVMNTDTL
ncbi:hypothetical protein AMS68_004454 [Peltaster fructicola]|uniref:N-acetyltransferase domain-containing protein n=1 Tax=Peltaster fructicola TaxID=286661 RepID=A0A6H0XVZ9_9PEZI|nr:hypothetical protein AMS68_004454 [Peltaster fructicola]